jgi:hypothetical protein
MQKKLGEACGTLKAISMKGHITYLNQVNLPMVISNLNLCNLLPLKTRSLRSIYQSVVPKNKVQR